jgi:hypothetical protein
MGGTIAASTPQNIVWAPANNNRPYYTLNGGTTWSPVTLPGVTSWSGFDWAYYLHQRSVTADRVLSNTFYLYYPGQGVFSTTNGGQSWTKVHSGYIESNSSMAGFNSTLMSVPGEAGNLFYTGGPQSGSTPTAPVNEPFYRSTNGGATWSAVPNVLDVFTYGFGAAAPGQSYPAIYIVGYVNNVYGIWQSTNNAQSWTNIGIYPMGQLQQITTISGDPNHFGEVYVGFAGGGYAYLPAASSSGPTTNTGFTGPTTNTGFIDLLNFEASFPDLIAAFGTNQTAMQNWYNTYEPIENRVETFDGLDYVASYPDLIAAFGAAGSMKAVQDDGASHYITNGEKEGRTTTFNGLDYIASYPDLIKAFGANADAGAYHYVEYGHNENRTTTFDGLDYVASYPDLIAAFGAAGSMNAVQDDGVLHYITNGEKEGRTTTFNGLDYIASYSDLIKAFGANADAGAYHYIEYGHNENRTTTFDGLDYIAQYTDLMNAFGANEQDGAAHYIEYGYYEGRTSGFNVAAYEQAHRDLVDKFPSNDAFLTAYINTYKATGAFLT